MCIRDRSIIIGPAIALHTYGAHIGQHCEILTHGALQMCLGDLVPEDKIRQAQNIQLFLRHIPQAADGKAGAGEGLAHHQILCLLYTSITAPAALCAFP